MTITDNVQQIIKNAFQNDWIPLDDLGAILLHTSVTSLNESVEYGLSVVAENILEYLDKIPLRSPIDNDFKTWWIDAYEYIIFDEDLTPDLYHDLGGKEFFENRLNIWFKDCPFHPKIGIYYFVNDKSPTLDYLGDTLFDIYALFQDGNFAESIWKENFCSNELNHEEIESLKHIKIKDLNTCNISSLILY